MSDPKGNLRPEQGAPRWEKKGLVEITSPFRGGLARFASGSPIQAGIAAIFGSDALGKGDKHWQDMDYGTYTVATYPHPVGRGGKILIQPMEPYGPLDGERLGGELGWALVRDVGIRTAWIHLIMAAHAMELANPTVDRFIITARKLAELLGYTGRGRGRKHRPLEEILPEMEEEMRLASAWGITLRQVKVFQDEERQGKTKRAPSVIGELEDRLWDIAIAREYQGRLDEPEGRGELRNIAWTVRPGQWAAYYLSDQGMRQWGLLAKQVLSIDPFHQPLAAKLAIYLQLQGRIRLAKGRDLKYTVGQLLDTLHEMPEPKPGQKNQAIRQARYRKRKQFNEAVEEILPDKGIITGGPAKHGLGYEWLTKGLRGRLGEGNIKVNWEQWLKAEIRFHLPEAQAEASRAVGEHQRHALKVGTKPGPVY